MKERPILFSAVKPQPNGGWVPYRCPDWRWNWVVENTGMGSGDPFRCPYGVPGDRLWVLGDWASRITLEVTDVRVERVRDISPDDAEADGNPWVWVIEFRRVEPEDTKP